MADRLLTRRAVMNRRTRLQAGYSLTEMLVVLAIIGIMTLIAVPNFMSYYRSSKLRSSMRQVTMDLRSARQHAVAANKMTKVTVQLGSGQRTYQAFDSSDNGTTWNQISLGSQNATVLAGSKISVQAPVYFSDSNVKDASGTFVDFIFLPSGTTQLPSGTTSATLVMSTTDKIAIGTYTVSIFPTGKVSAK